MSSYHVKLTFTEDILGTAPSDPEIYSKHIANANAKLIKRAEKKGKADEVAALMSEDQKLAAEEVQLLPEDTEKGVTVFRRDKDGTLALMDFMIRGFLKEAQEAITGQWGGKSKIDKFVFVKQRTIPLLRAGRPITEPDGTFERPLRAETMRGPRVSLAASEIVKAEGDVTCEFDLMVLPLGENDKKMKIDEELLHSWLEYGELCGIGQWRSGSYGRFTAELTKK